MVLVLTEHDVATLLQMPDAVRLVEEAFRHHAAGETLLMPRMSTTLPGTAGAFRAMAALLPRSGMFGVKTLTGYPGRRAEHETYFALLLFDATDGALRAVMAAGQLTAIRTGAATGVAAKYLSRPDSATVGLIGAGVQGFQQIAALAAVRRLDLVKVFDPVTDSAARFVRRVETELGLRARQVASAREAVVGLDLVVTATTATQPVLQAEWIEPGTHVSGIGANTPAKRELDATTFQRSKVIVDFKEQALAEAGDLQAAIRDGAITAEDVHAELGDVIVGRATGRADAGEITLFKSVGVAIEDVAVAAEVYKQALAKGLGTALAFTNPAPSATAAVTP